MSPDDLRRISEVRALVASGEARNLRELRHLTLREIAAAVGASSSTVHRWEQGECAPRSVHALRWADVLGIKAKAH